MAAVSRSFPVLPVVFVTDVFPSSPGKKLRNAFQLSQPGPADYVASQVNGKELKNKWNVCMERMEHILIYNFNIIYIYILKLYIIYFIFYINYILYIIYYIILYYIIYIYTHDGNLMGLYIYNDYKV